MAVELSGRLRLQGGMSVEKRARCEIGFSDLTLEITNENARMLRDALCDIYGPPAHIQKALRDAKGKPARRLSDLDLPPEAMVIYHTLTPDWCDTDTVRARLDQPMDESTLRRGLNMLRNAGKIERRAEAGSARRTVIHYWRTR